MSYNDFTMDEYYIDLPEKIMGILQEMCLK